VRLAVVVQRYGADINGGAELHARYIAEHLSQHHDVEVLTTCARDYVTWRNALPAGEETVNGVAVRRFPVSRERRPEEFGRRSRHVFDEPHSLQDELSWLQSEGPTSPALIKHVRERQHAFDYFCFFSFRYYHAYHGVRAASRQAILVPTAERDAAIGLALFRPVFRGVRAIMYNSFEERRMIQSVADNRDVPGTVVGVGSDVPEDVHPSRFRKTYGIPDPFVVYVGRIDENKGCKDLFAYFEQYVKSRRSPLSLVLIGNSVLPIPDHPQIRHLGFLPDRDKFDGIAAAAALVMPSYLRGQCIRSNAGLYYDSYAEFAESLSVLETQRLVSAALGRNGREYFHRHYAWPVIERKYLNMLEQLRTEERSGAPSPVLEPLPGWWARRRRDLRPAGEVLSRVPEGPVLPSRRSASRPRAAVETA
jgi:glycosyltransferase involved in cell wall biosynthesis